MHKGAIACLRLTDGTCYESISAAARDNWVSAEAIHNAIRRGGTAAGHRWARIGPDSRDTKAPLPSAAHLAALECTSLVREVADWIRWEAEGAVSRDDAWNAIRHLWYGHPLARNLLRRRSASSAEPIGQE